MSEYFALVDCNNFYVSCEQVFNPSLRGKAVVVLSNNDGCVISRSQEAKAAGIKMGQPFFEIEKMVEEGRVIALSANFTLYGDMSRRVMETLSFFSPFVEIYSIDEAFLLLDNNDVDDLLKYGEGIKEYVYRWTGIPVAVGIAPTKTLAKVATYIAKHDSPKSVVFIRRGEDLNPYLEKVPVEEIWGIGRSYSEFLQLKGVKTAADFVKLPEQWVKRYMKINGVRTWRELQGKKVFSLSERSIRKSFITSRTFGEPVEDFESLKSSIITFMKMSVERLREEGYLASEVTIFISSSLHVKDIYRSAIVENLQSPTDYLPDLIAPVEDMLKRIYRKGVKYRKAGVVLSGLIRKENYQYELFTPAEVVRRKENLMAAIEEISGKFGRDSIKLGGESLSSRWKSVQKHLSRRYTTSWDGIPVVRG